MVLDMMFMMPDHKIMPHIPVHGSLTDIPTSHHEREVSVKSYDGAVTKTPVGIKNIWVKLRESLKSVENASYLCEDANVLEDVLSHILQIHNMCRFSRWASSTHQSK